MTPIYERTVYGIYMMGFMAIVAAFISTAMFMSDDPDKPYWTLLIFAVVPLFFGVMKVSVDKRELRIRFPLGVPRRTLAIADIEAVTVTRSKMETGFGVSVKPSHGRYCISGPSAVSILMGNGRTVLVGTPEPEKLLKAIEKARSRNRAGTGEA
jgi:hypothetical protein